jgi:hypothetical protein
MISVSIMVPIFNEELHLKRLLPFLKKLDIPFFILDSDSTDKSIEIVKKYKVKFYTGKWKTFSHKLNYGLKLNPYKSDWIVRLDADEYFDVNFIKLLKANKFQLLNVDVDAIYVNRKIMFMGKWMRHGGIYPGKIIRIIRPGKAFYEIKELDEHVISKNPIYLNIDIVDSPLYDLPNLLRKYIKYAEIFRDNYFKSNKRRLLRPKKGQDVIKVFLQNIFIVSPIFLRSFMYWFYRYIIKLGFLDGLRGFIFNIIHAFFYRFILDACIYEKKISLKSKQRI